MPLMYVLGIQKGGTSTLSHTLQHALKDAQPNVSSRPNCGAHASKRTGTVPATSKESHFLHHRWLTTGHGSPRERFTSLYDPAYCPSECFLEMTPDNLADKNAPRRLAIMMSALEAARARFVVSLREPVARDISWYHQARANNDDIQKSYHSYVTSRLNQIQQCAAPLGGSANVSLDLYVRCTQGSVIYYGWYWGQLRTWEQHFAPAQFLVLQMESLFNRPVESVQRELFAHLGMGRVVQPRTSFPHINTHDVYSYPGRQSMMSCASVQMMARSYKPWNARLFAEYPHLTASLWKLPVCSSDPAAKVGPSLHTLRGEQQQPSARPSASMPSINAT